MICSDPPLAPPDDAATGLPGLRTWLGVYLVVCAIFVLWVALLTALTRWFPAS